MALRINTRALGWFIAAFGIINVVLQIAYPLASRDTKRVLTIASVVAFFCFSLCHAAATRGLRGVGAIGVFVVGGLVAERIGSTTGVPFGNYDYASTLGWKVIGVPIVVPLAWAMMGWPALRCANALAAGLRHRRWVVVAYGALILTAWDLLLDPQMVGAGHWVWRDTAGPWLNGIPLLNSVGWFVVAAVLLTIADVVAGWRAAAGSQADTPILLMVVWTWFSETLGHLVFFGTHRVGLIGGVIFALVLMPWVQKVAVPSMRQSVALRRSV